MKRGLIKDCDWGAWSDQTDADLDLGLQTASAADTALVEVRDCTYVGVGFDSDDAVATNSARQIRVVGGAEDYWVGIQVLDGGKATLTHTTVDSAFGTSACGMLVESRADIYAPLVREVSGTIASGIRVDADSAEVVLVDSLATATVFWSYPQIRNCTYGLDVLSKSRPKVRASIIADNYSCVRIGPEAVPDLGDSGTGGPGNNLIKNSARGQLLAGGGIRFPGTPTVYAEGNYWGSNPPVASKISSWVDYTPYLTTNPLSMSGTDVAVGVVDPVSASRLAYPMPFVTRVSIPLLVPVDRTPVNVKVFNVQGRLVRTLAAGPLSSGEHIVNWDGKFESGVRAPAGVYFVHILVGAERATQRLVLAH